MVLSPEELKKLQGVCLELVCEVDRVCRKNGIEYTLEGESTVSSLGMMMLISPCRESSMRNFSRPAKKTLIMIDSSCRNTEQIQSIPGGILRSK